MNLGEAAFAYDEADPEGFRSGMARLGPLLGAEKTGMTVYDLPPGQAVCPYHYEYAEEEWLVVLAGRPTLRRPSGTRELAPWDVAYFERGREGAHGIRNETDEPVRVLMFSDVVHPAVTVYPDSDKVGVYTGHSDDDLVVRRASAVGYFAGEA